MYMKNFKIKMKINLFLLLIILIAFMRNGESKRSFGFGRNRPKTSTSNLSVRRKGHLSSDSVPKPATNQQVSKPVAPPPYTPHSNVGHSNLNGAPPPYSSNPSLIYPRQQIPHSGLYSNTGNNFGSYPSNWPNYGHSMPNYGHSMPNYGHSMPNYGHSMPGYGQSMPNYGMPMTMPMYQQKSSLMPGIATNVLTGLAVWQLTKAFGGGHRDTHVYHHQVPSEVSSVADGPQTLQRNPSIPTNTESSRIAPVDTSNSTSAVTPIPDFDNQFVFSTIHPSLYPYASPTQFELLDYWDKSHKRVLNTNDSPASDLKTSTTTAPE